LNSSLAELVGGVMGFSQNGQGYLFWDSNLIFTLFWFLIYNFGSRYARMPNMGSKDSMIT